MKKISLVLASMLMSTVALGQGDPREEREELLKSFVGGRAQTAAPGVESLAATELIINGGFEAGQAPGPGLGYSGTSGSWNWTTSDGMLNPIWTDTPSHTGPPTARTGAWCVYFSPFGPVTNTVSQQVAIPAGATASLSYWIKISTFETTSLSAYDTMSVRILGTSNELLATVATYSNLNAASAYVQKTADLSAWAGRSVRIQFSASNDISKPTIFLLDDVSITSTTTGGGPGVYAATWVLPSSARVTGANAFWTTDLSVTNAGSVPASVNLKFLGHEGAGSDGPERTFTVQPKATSSWADVLSQVFGRESDYGPILIRSDSTALVSQGQTWTAGPSGGAYGQSVPAVGSAEAVGSAARTLTGVSQNSRFRTNLVLANMKAAEAVANIDVYRADGTSVASTSVSVGSYGFVQLNLAGNLGVNDLSNGSIRISSPTLGAQLGVYASVIDASTSDPRTVLPR